MHEAGAPLRQARQRAGLTQAQLAERASVTQPVVSRAEGANANPRVATLDRLLRAARLELSAPEVGIPDVDEGQILAHLRLTPAERISVQDASKRYLDAAVRSMRRVD